MMHASRWPVGEPTNPDLTPITVEIRVKDSHSAAARTDMLDSAARKMAEEAGQEVVGASPETVIQRLYWCGASGASFTIKSAEPAAEQPTFSMRAHDRVRIEHPMPPVPDDAKQQPDEKRPAKRPARKLPGRNDPA